MAFGYFLFAAIQKNDVLTNEIRRNLPESSAERQTAEWLLAGDCRERDTFASLLANDISLAQLGMAECLRRAGDVDGAGKALAEARGAGADPWLAHLMEDSLRSANPKVQDSLKGN